MHRLINKMRTKNTEKKEGSINMKNNELAENKIEVMTMAEMEELEDMVCLGDGGTISCCNGRDGNSGISVNADVM